jgi:hypothetical protein
MFAFDDHGAVGPDLVEPLGRILVHAARIHAGQRVLDIAGGTGIAAIPRRCSAPRWSPPT